MPQIMPTEVAYASPLEGVLPSGVVWVGNFPPLVGKHVDHTQSLLPFRS